MSEADVLRDAGKINARALNGLNETANLPHVDARRLGVKTRVALSCTRTGEMLGVAAEL